MSEPEPTGDTNASKSPSEPLWGRGILISHFMSWNPPLTSCAWTSLDLWWYRLVRPHPRLPRDRSRAYSGLCHPVLVEVSLTVDFVHLRAKLGRKSKSQEEPQYVSFPYDVRMSLITDANELITGGRTYLNHTSCALLATSRPPQRTLRTQGAISW